MASFNFKKVTKFIFWILAIGIVIFLMNRLYGPIIKNYLFLKKEKAQLLQQKNDMLSNAETLKGQIKSSREDMGLEKSARTELNLKKEGEGVIFVSEATTTTTVPLNQPGLSWLKIKAWFSKIGF